MTQPKILIMDCSVIEWYPKIELFKRENPTIEIIDEIKTLYVGLTQLQQRVVMIAYAIIYFEPEKNPLIKAIN